MSTRIQKSRKAAPEPQRKNRTVMIGGGAAVLVVVAVTIWAGGQALIPEPAPDPIPEQVSGRSFTPGQPAQPAAKPEARTFSESLLAAETPEQPAEIADQSNEETDLNIPFQLEQVAYALSRVDVDENGDLVINEAAQTVLEQAFLDARVTMDEQQLEELKAMIEAGLDGPAGIQAVEVAEKYYRYSNAFREISDTLAMRGDPRSLRNDYEQVTRLRRTHLGPELAEQLYGREEKLTRYTLEVMEIQADPNLTPEQRAEKQEALFDRYPEVSPGDDLESDPPPEQSTN